MIWTIIYEQQISLIHEHFSQSRIMLAFLVRSEVFSVRSRMKEHRQSRSYGVVHSPNGTTYAWHNSLLFPAKRDAATKTESFYEQQQFTIMLIIKTVQCMSPPSTLMSAHAAEPAQKHRSYKDKRLSYRSQDLTRAVRVLQELHHQSNKFQKGISLRILRRWLAISVLLWKQPITI